jgi:triphosphoribosyl-dephospho-CoA synthetase
MAKTRAIVKNSSGQITNQGVFPDLQAAQAWYSFNSVHFPSGNSVEYVDITSELLEMQRDAESEEALQVGTAILRDIRKLNRKKLKSGQMTEQAFNQLISSQSNAVIERLLRNGSLLSAKFLIEELNGVYTEQEITDVIAKIVAHESKWAHLT